METLCFRSADAAHVLVRHGGPPQGIRVSVYYCALGKGACAFINNTLILPEKIVLKDAIVPLLRLGTDNRASARHLPLYLEQPIVLTQPFRSRNRTHLNLPRPGCHRQIRQKIIFSLAGPRGYHSPETR